MPPLCMIDIAPYNVIVFGVDNVIRTTNNGSVTPNNGNEYMLMAGVKSTFSKLREIEFKRSVMKEQTGIFFSFLANQGGVQAGFYTPQKARSLIRECVIEAFSGDFPPFHIGICHTTNGADHQRKPNPGLFEDLMRLFPNLPPQKVLIIGNEEDNLLAQKVGAHFIDHKEFFSEDFEDSSLTPTT